MPTIAHPAVDTLQGVAARRGRRFRCGRDVILHRRGLRKMASLRRHGGSGRVSDHNPCASCPERRAGRVCAAHKGAGDGGCVGIVRREGHRPEGNPFRPRRHGVRCGIVQTERPFPETGETRPPLPPLQRDRSRGQKPPNGAPEGAAYNIQSRQLRRPVRMLFDKTTGGKSAAGMQARDGKPAMPAAARRSSAPSARPACQGCGWHSRAWCRGLSPWRR